MLNSEAIAQADGLDAVHAVRTGEGGKLTVVGGRGDSDDDEAERVPSECACSGRSGGWGGVIARARAGC